MRELPFFKFNPANYLSGDITVCSLAAQGLFMNILCFYWMKGCSMTLASLKLRFSHAEATLNELLSHGIIKTVDGQDDVVIEFLKQQRDEFMERHEILSNAGRTGGLKAKGRLKAGLTEPKGRLKPPSNNKEEDKEEDKELDNNLKIIIPDRLKDKLKSKNLKQVSEMRANFYNNLLKEGKSKEDANAAADKQIESDIRMYEAFMKWIEENASSVNDLKEPFSIRQYVQFRVERPKPEVRKYILTEMHNWKDLTKKRKVAYTTALNQKLPVNE